MTTARGLRGAQVQADPAYGRAGRRASRRPKSSAILARNLYSASQFISLIFFVFVSE